MTGTSHILVVDDSPTQLRQMQMVLEQDGFIVRAVENAQAALEAIERELPALVVTDLEMPGMSGLELVETLHCSHKSLPVLLTTAEGSEDVAAEALRRGATSYVPKRDISRTLCSVARQILSVHYEAQSVREIAKFAVGYSLKLTLGNDESLVPKIIARLEQPLVELELFDEGERMQIAMALDEALVNAIIHGNLEVSSDLRQTNDGQAYVDKISQRKSESPYRDRKLHVILDANRDLATFTIRDEGNGFDCAELRDPTNPENLERAGGRGLLLIHAFMDEVSHNDVGNEIVMVKRKPTPESTDAEPTDDSAENAAQN
ncbi:Nitrogen regulation protein NR(I) [Rubripirellula lacrimiformis]|uniref:Nitrogen regulation protein NR(I) n=1 Tax=Rubripirellula lacrimiformis TaxID=1930273 RepID=A0A517NKK5_9BACT|nr:response regulator [Rubripirellula lacrimiformis]QDT07609.1 Nitrogen regulation protein NR(I) [Rubripirellula lacrimiformis]